MAAGRIMLRRLSELAAAREDFAFESTLSSRSFAPFLQRLKAAGYRIAIYYFSLDSAQLAVRRVKLRVSLGGHDVPADRILARYPRTLHNLTKAVRRASVAYLYEARETSDGGPQLVAICEGHQTTRVVDAVPRWAEQVLAG